jgi:hypothetical protein
MLLQRHRAQEVYELQMQQPFPSQPSLRYRFRLAEWKCERCFRNHRYGELQALGLERRCHWTTICVPALGDAGE